MLAILLKGLLIGALVSMPLGPNAILIIQRTASKNFKVGYSSAMGVLLTDSIFILIAGYSLGYLFQFLNKYESVLQIIGAIVLLILGYSIFRTKPHKLRRKREANESYLQHFASTLLISSSNPALILAYIAVLASFGISFQSHGIPYLFTFIAGFVFGSASWWLIITSIINYFRNKFNSRILFWFNRISGASIITIVLIGAIFIVFKNLYQ